MSSFGSAGNQALNQLNNLPFENIIGGPLNAAIQAQAQAQAQAAETTVDFIQSVGMQEVNGQKEAINVQFVYEDSSGQARRITVPILAIVPIPFIVIDSVDIAFKAKITASASANSSQSRSSSGYVNGSMGYAGTRFRASLNAGYSAKKDSRASQESKYSVEYTMDVQVHASQAGLPAGMEAVLGFLQQGTHELPVTLQTKLNGLAKSYSVDASGAFTTAPRFYLIVNNANNQPILNLTSNDVTITSANGFLTLASQSGFADGADTEDGVYKITLSAGTLPSTAPGDEFVDELNIIVSSDGDEISLSRQITLRVA